MTYYDDEPTEASEAVAVDDRLSLMQEFVDLDAKAQHLSRERERMASQSEKLEQRMRQIRNRLGGLLGFTDPMADAKAALKAEVEQMRARQ